MKDYHCHILPEMDDGAKDVETSEKMLEMLFEQGVDAVVLTPHYYMSKESAESFLKRREKSFLELKKSNFNRIKYVLGAEVYLEKHISKIEYMEKLCFGSSKYILIEMPYSPIKDWMLKELDDIYYNLQLIPIFAHLDRYIKIYTKNDYKNLLQYDCVYQFNNNELLHHKTKSVIKYFYTVTNKIIFGTDCHNLDERKPCVKNIKKGIEKNIIKWYNLVDLNF